MTDQIKSITEGPQPMNFNPAIFLNPHASAIVATGPVPVLDKGHVALLHVAGTDDLVVYAARASYGMEGKDVSPSKLRSLVRRLMRDEHTSPFEMPTFWFHVKWPIYTARQADRHRNASRSERSGRYTELPPDEFQRTAPDAWRLQSKDNKQGSAGVLPRSHDDQRNYDGEMACFRESTVLAVATEDYVKRLDAGIAREQARKDLPQSAYTEWVWKIDLHNLLHFLRLRLAPDAQLEIRQYAQAIAAMVDRLFPLTWVAFQDYRMESMTLSRDEIAWARSVTLGYAMVINMSEAEQAACRAKLARLGLIDGNT